VPRLPVGLVPEADRLPLGSDVWGETAVSLPDGAAGGRWRNVFTGDVMEAPGGRLAVGEALRDFPVALLLKE
jgi:maltooligosyltrehalose synthase